VDIPFERDRDSSDIFGGDGFSHEAAMVALKLTFDTNGLINALDPTSSSATSVAELKTLIQYGLSGKVEIAITTRVEDDLLRDKDSDRLANMLSLLSIMPVIGSDFRPDTSKLSDAALLAGPDSISSEIQRILFPGLTETDSRFNNKRNDIDHIVGHYRGRRDIFVTDDRGIWRRADELESTFGIIVKKPGDCLRYVDEAVSRSAPRTVPANGTDQSYQSRSLKGRVCFDYSNNNGRYIIGDGYFAFETKWSKSSDTSIVVYSREPSIENIAIAKRVSAIGDIHDASMLDYSSEHRRPQVGQIVVWRNVNGLYAATQVIDVRDDTRGAADDEVTFDYVILDKGGYDFSV
jgi:hypothetical protein